MVEHGISEPMPMFKQLKAAEVASDK